jgi:UDP-N-acetylmuramoyl-L-alanyl-D-glutamate--2,6-diaminopimelate ligase
MRLPPPPPWASGLFTVGVTGTNGKTTTTAFVARALATLSRPVPRVTTVGAFLDEEKQDVPPDHEGFLDVMQRAHDRGARHAAIEVTSEALAIGFARAWPFRIGVFTNLSRDHLDAHPSPEHYLASKAQLFVHLPPGGMAVLNGCDPAAALIAEVVPAHARIVWYGAEGRGEAHAPLDLQAREVTVSWEGTRARLEKGSDRHAGLPDELFLRAHGAVYVDNALAAIAAAVEAGVPPAEAAAVLAVAAPPPGRFEVVALRPYVVVDYAHSPDALARTLAAARALCGGRLTVVFGAGGDRDRGKRRPMGEAARGADRVILTSDNPRREDPGAIIRAIREGLEGHGDVREIVDRAEAIETAIAEAGPEDVVVIAGRGPETEQVLAQGTRRLCDAEVARAAVGART